jgi:hypothetical protein
MKRLIAVLIALQLCLIPQAKADMFGGDVAVLVQILTNAYQQLTQLQNMVKNGQDTFGLMQDINRGINDSLNLIRTISPNTNPGLYKDWDQVSSALAKLGAVYGVAIESNDARVQRDADQNVAEAVALNNSIYKYSDSIEQLGDLIAREGETASPGRATKLTAASLGIMLKLQNEMLRTQATGLKLQAQTLAVQNRKDKERTRQMVAGADDLNSALTNQKPQFALPRFD